jgi:hypothetical protein
VAGVLGLATSQIAAARAELAPHTGAGAHPVPLAPAQALTPQQRYEQGGRLAPRPATPAAPADPATDLQRPDTSEQGCRLHRDLAPPAASCSEVSRGRL